MTNKDKDERQIVKRELGLHPIKDAVTPLKFWIKKEHIEKAIPKDFTACVNTLAIQSVTGQRKGVATFKKTCYVPVDKNGDGNFIIERYAVRQKLSKAIRNFDKLGVFDPGEYTLFPPTKSMQLEHRKKKNKVDRAKAKGKPKKAAKTKRPKELSFLDERNGTGHANLVVKSLVNNLESGKI